MTIATITHYPPDKDHAHWGMFGTLAFHFGILFVAVAIALLTHVKTLQDLMRDSGSIATRGPADSEPLELTFTDDPPPPPATEVDFVRQILIPKPQPVSLMVVPKPPTPKPLVLEKPKYTAPHATGSGETETVSRLVVGSAGFPVPGYPIDALLKHETGTVVLSLLFNGEGRVSEADVIKSSGVNSLDYNARSWVRYHWRDESFAGQSVTVPIEYRL